MKFRPCIDIHNGRVKQIVGGSLADAGSYAKENFVSELNGDFYANLYKARGLNGGHIILLNPADSEYYAEDVKQAMLALEAFPGGMQIGGGITAENAERFINAGASHVIVTSYVFRNKTVDMERLKRLNDAVGKNHLVLDLSCRRRDDGYYIVTDRWQNFTDLKITDETLDFFGEYCDEFLVHAVDVEGKQHGIEEEVVRLLKDTDTAATYAGGISSFDDLEKLQNIGRGKIDYTIGSALDIFGGTLPFEEVVRFGTGACRRKEDGGEK